MIKAFISHSSAQKDFARELVKELGRDICVFDEYSFEAGTRTMDEIIRTLNDCHIFILLLSEEALASDWVKKEIMLSRDLIEASLLDRFQPFLIDDRIDHTHKDIASWIKKDYNLQQFTKPLLLARKIKETIRELSWTKYPYIKEKELFFIGRKSELGEIETKYYDGNGRDKKVIIASGFTGVGRKRLLLKYIEDNLSKNKTYEPLLVEMGEHANIEDFILQLNDKILKYSIDELLELIKGSKDDKLSLAISLINDISNANEKIIIRDLGACVLSDGRINTWFMDVIKHPNLEDRLCMFLTSISKPIFSIERNFNEVINVRVYPFNKEERKKFFYAYLELNNLEL